MVKAVLEDPRPVRLTLEPLDDSDVRLAGTAVNVVRRRELIARIQD